MRKRTIILFLFLYLLLGVFFSFYSNQKKHVADVDITQVNKITKEVEKHLDNLQELPSGFVDYAFTVSDAKHKILYQNGSYAEATKEEAIRHHNTYTQVGDKLICMETNNGDLMKAYRNRLQVVFLVAYLVIGMVLAGGIWYVNRQYFKPFIKMEEFARQVSNGNLDYPLNMDKKNLFGAFTESFDRMRDELKLAKETEYKANASKQELVASLSHDIKTPVTSIKVITEVLLVKEQDEKMKEKLENIYGNADKIDALVSNLFESTLKDLGELQVVVTDANSKTILSMIEHADYRNLVTVSGTTHCLVQMDPLRMEQVITNIIVNSYKYADTRIEVTIEERREELRLRFKDFGHGVEEGELPLIFQKFYRSKNPTIRQQKGTGLGLYICHYCMEQMGGHIDAYKEEDGFVIEVGILYSE
ncbi:sensor histidine kinase [Anaerosporobacter faecicola]|uniref:sensor histidine kinase n=1 Tax=Anaerosporobacter faecicola TaxID=2718714 RepID=UPI001438DA4B|nr:HAMP domain-containing sensor histidine kinase [Anaerosporobacter faecicola]